MAIPTVFESRSSRRSGVDRSPADPGAPRDAHRLIDRSPEPARAKAADLDSVVLCGSGDLEGLAGAAGDVRGVVLAEVVAKQLRLVARHGDGVLSRVLEVADLCDVDVEMIVVFPLHS